MSRSFRAVTATLVAAALAAAGCSSSAGDAGAKHVAIVAYSVPKAAYDDLEQAFARTAAGQGVTFSASYGPSGTQSKQVASGQPADYVGFSLEPDLTRLVPAFVAAGWDAGSTKGIVSDSVVVLVVRRGNPKHITGWDDLVRPGVKIVTPDPASSGSAKWNVLAAYEHVIADGGTAAAAENYLTDFFRHVVAKPSSGANATTTFTSGTGDVLISYENEAIAARAKGAAVDYLVPRESVLIENPAAVTVHASRAAKDFLAFVRSAAGQRIFAAHGFRPVLGSVHPTGVKGANDPGDPFPAVTKLVRVEDLGGWSRVNEEFFGANGIVTLIEKRVG